MEPCRQPAVGDTLYTHRSDGKLRAHKITQVINNHETVIVIADGGRFSSSVKMSDIVWIVDAWYENGDDT